jgi:hypothetical protein
LEAVATHCELFDSKVNVLSQVTEDYHPIAGYFIDQSVALGVILA